ncbi:hypothetical protein V5O48_017310 [Marasmius crinis-equi]|uniref:Uncharacterized protein n=1 Tax=Marasmius crinis-equi TaxID=585013 RepID=A0ABR3EPA7_9AGAR
MRSNRNRGEDYEALLTEDSLVDGTQYTERPSLKSGFIPSKSSFSLPVILLCLSNVFFAWLWLSTKTKSSSETCGYPNAQILYSPVQDLLEYHPYKFYTGELQNIAPDIYSRPPSKEVDDAWTDLYND